MVHHGHGQGEEGALRCGVVVGEEGLLWMEEEVELERERANTEHQKQQSHN